MKDILAIRKILKSKKPKFLRQDSNILKGKTKSKWRKPRGLHNKRRLHKKGHQKNPSVGFKSPKLVKNLLPSGKIIHYLTRIDDLKGFDSTKHEVLISSGVGLKNKIKILEKCLESNIPVSNVKDIAAFLKDSKSKLTKRKDTSKGRKIKKKKEEEKASKKKEEKKDEGNKDDAKKEEVKKEVLGAKQEEKKISKGIDVKKDTTKSKSGHMARSVPGTKQ
jgi:large subunit ribosomal protein L32e